jgi:hypothetical protein
MYPLSKCENGMAKLTVSNSNRREHYYHYDNIFCSIKNLFILTK